MEIESGLRAMALVRRHGVAGHRNQIGGGRERYLSDTARNGETVERGHPKIEEHQVGPEYGCPLYALDTVSGCLYVVSIKREQQLRAVHGVWMVVDN
jgi:hypothetical protein